MQGAPEKPVERDGCSGGVSASWVRHSLGIPGLWRRLLSPLLPEGHTAHRKAFTGREPGRDAPARNVDLRITSTLRSLVGGGQ